MTPLTAKVSDTWLAYAHRIRGQINDENMKDHTEVTETDKRNSSQNEERNRAVPENINLAEGRINQQLHQGPKPPEGVSSEGEKKILIEEPATRYTIGGIAELGKFLDVFEFCHPLGPEIVIVRRFFVRIEVSETPAVALVDSGASRTYVGPKFADRYGDRVFETPDPRTITLANGSLERISGQIRVPISIYVPSNEMAIRLVKALAYDCVLGMNALELFDVSINFKERTWQLRNGTCMTFNGIEGSTYSDDERVAGICELDDIQMDRLQRLLDELIPSGKPKLGLTHLTKHSIDVQGAKPIKQRYYPVSLKVREEMYQIIDKLLELFI